MLKTTATRPAPNDYQNVMTSVDNGSRLATLHNATEKAFGAVFFFLPISKPLLFSSLLVAFALFVFSGGFGRALRSWRRLPWTIPAAILAAVPLLSAIIHGTGDQRFSNLELSYYWVIAGMTFLAASQIRILAWMRAQLCGIFVVFCYSQLMAKGLGQFDYAPSAMANYILYSQFLAVGIVLLSILYKYEKERPTRAIYLVGMGLFFFGLASGLGRTGMLVVLILLPFVFSNIFIRQNRFKVVLACVIAGLALLMSPTVQHRIKEVGTDMQLFRQEVTHTSLGYRFEMWKTAWGVFRTHPLTGGGPAGFGAAWTSEPREEIAKAFVEPHNAFLFFASRYGVFALIALVWLYGALLWTGWTQRHSFEGSIVFAFAMILLLSSFTNTLFMGAVSHAWLMLFIGLQGALLHASSKTVQESWPKAAAA